MLLVHRPRYDDWTFPKGKLELGETHEGAAVREVEEETGFRCELGRELPSTSYRDSKARPKLVRYWAMRPVGGEFQPHHEVDEIRWLPVEAAAELSAMNATTRCYTPSQRARTNDAPPAPACDGRPPAPRRR